VTNAAPAKPKSLLDRLGTPIFVALIGLTAFQWLNRSAAGPKENTQAVPFSLTLANRPGQTATLAAYAGQPLVIEVMASWCSACKAMAPRLAALSQEPRSLPVKFLSVAVDSSLAEAQSIHRDWRMPYDLAIGDHSFSQAYEISVLPTLIVVDPTGKIRHVTTGVTSEYRINGWLDELGAHRQ
jgi:thiol-disulfide isomerase/thioredoxin